MFKEDISEKLVVRIWECQAITNLMTDMGDSVDVIFPGRVCNDGGCDFQNAVFTIGGRLMKGNIEVHLKSSHWYSHGHHENKKYNDILLHVVMWHDCKSATILQNGVTIPTVSLVHCLRYPLDKCRQKLKLSGGQVYTCLEAKNHASKKSLIKSLNAAGERRFAEKAALFQERLVGEKPEQVLLRGIARALGYNKNVDPFEVLIDKLPPGILESITDKSGVIIPALLLGIAGLLPSQRAIIKYDDFLEDPEIEQLEVIWRASNITDIMNCSAWCFHRVRPDNFPSRRIVALGCFVAQHCQSGFLKSIMRLVAEAPETGGYSSLENKLVVYTRGYWASHFDFGTVNTRGSALIGRSRAGEIAINVVLPFAYAYGGSAKEPVLKRNALNLYTRYPGLQDNQITLFMKQQLSLGRSCKLPAHQQQGLIYIFKSFCRYRNCQECLINTNRC